MGPETTPVLIAVLTVGVALAGLMTGLFAWVRQEGREHRQETRELRQDVKGLRRDMGDLRERITRLEGGVARLEDRVEGLAVRVVRLEGMMDDVREAVAHGVGRVAAE